MKRILSIDVFRGLTVMLMILVNHASLSTTYQWLVHAPWDGCTLADVVFPFFLLIVGVSSVLAITHLKRKGVTDSQCMVKLFRRGLWIFCVGLFLNIYPTHWHLEYLRIPGVLQRIAICYGVVSFLYLRTSVRLQMTIMGGILFFYWYLLTAGSFSGGGYGLSFGGNIVGYVDRILLGGHHLYQADFDPEGLLSTLPAIVTTMFGGLLGHWLLRMEITTNNALSIGGVGVCVLTLGALWGGVFPINKALWTSSYVLWTTGLAFVSYALCYWVVDVKHCKRWCKPFEILGTNALFVYVFHVMLIKTQMIVFVHDTSGSRVNLKTFLIQTFSYYLSIENASLFYASLSVLLCFGVVVLWTRARQSISFISA